MRAKLALVAATMLSFSVEAIEIPVLEPPISLFIFALFSLTLMLSDELLVFLDDIVKERHVLSGSSLFLLLFVSLLLALSWGLFSLLWLLLRIRNYIFLLLRIPLIKLLLRILFRHLSFFGTGMLNFFYFLGVAVSFWSQRFQLSNTRG